MMTQAKNDLAANWFGAAPDAGAEPRPDFAEPIATRVWLDLFRRRCGLSFRDAQVPMLLQRLAAQRERRALPSDEAYYALLAAAPDGSPAWNEVLEGVLNHETSFFRHPASFDALRTRILPDLIARRAGKAQLSFWSAGCSTGQETYSLAMIAMAEEALGGQFLVWGSDLSRRVIEMARRGRYGPRALNGLSPTLRQRFFSEIQTERGPEFEVIDELRQRVRFMSINLFSACDFNPRYDVIFCHNVLIYFAPTAATRLLAELAARLRVGGYLLLGPGEGPGDQPPGLEPLHVPGVRGFRRTGQASAEGRS
jgi:chemotaxis methyl-accepting protein methylase